MELYEEILAKSFSTFQFNAEKIIELKCYQALQKIKSIIEDDELDDPECFFKIEEIICVFQSIGSNGGFRHDF